MAAEVLRDFVRHLAPGILNRAAARVSLNRGAARHSNFAGVKQLKSGVTKLNAIGRLYGRHRVIRS